MNNGEQLKAIHDPAHLVVKNRPCFYKKTYGVILFANIFLNASTLQSCLNMPTCTYIDSDSETTCWLIDHPLSSSKPSLPFLIHKSLHRRPPCPIPLITPNPKRTRLIPNSQPPTCRLPSLDL